MKDIINSFKAHLYERTSSPLIGAFIFYWLIFNYKMLIILFDDKLKSSEKFTNIDTIYQNDLFFDIPLNGVIYPIIATLLYLLVFPWISNLIFEGWTYHQNNLKKIGNKKVLTYKEYGDLQRRFTEVELSFDDTFSKKDNEINQLKSLLTEKDELILNLKEQNTSYNETINTNKKILSDGENHLKEKEKLNSQINKLKEENQSLKEIHKKYPDVQIEGLEKIEIDILKKIGDSLYFDINRLKSQFNLHKIKADLIKDKLINENYIEKYPGRIQDYRLTEKSKKILLENSLI